MLHVQGGGQLNFIDQPTPSKTLNLSYAAKNQHPYSSLGALLIEQGHIDEAQMSIQAITNYFAKHPENLTENLAHNKRFVFFRTDNEQPKSANNTSHVAHLTVAVDPTIIPLGSMLLLERPIIVDGKKIASQLQFAIANDTGSAIKGPGRLGVYLGDDMATASNLRHTGRVWLLKQK